MPQSAQRKPGNAAPGRAFDLICGRAGPQVAPRSGSLRNFPPRVRNRTHTPMPHDGSEEYRAPSANLRKEKIARCPRCRLNFRANFRPLRAAQTNRLLRAKATTVQETDAPRAIAN